MSSFNSTIMKYFGSTLLAGGILAGGIYLTLDKANYTEVSQGIEAITTKEQVSYILDYNPASNLKDSDSIVSSGGYEFNIWKNILETNQTLRMRIQGMSWHRSCILGQLDLQDCLDYIAKAVDIENTLILNPSLLSDIQYEFWWQKYLSGNILPESLIIGHIPSFQQIQSFKNKNSDLYQKISNSPIWNNLQDPGNPNNEDLISYQAIFLNAIDTLTRDIQNNPEVTKKLQQYGLAIDNLYYENNLSASNSAYQQMNAIISIENERRLNATKWAQFLNSEIGRQYINGEADVIMAQKVFLTN